MPITPEIAAHIDASPLRDARMLWRYDSVGTVAHDLIAAEKKLAAITLDEVDALLMHLSRQTEEFGSSKLPIGTAKDNDLYISGREIRMGPSRWNSSAVIPGLFANRTMPPDPDAHTKAAAQVNRMLTNMGHTPQAVGGQRIRGLNYKEDFETTEFTIPTPERAGEYHLFGNYAHRPEAMREAQSYKIAKLIDLRIRNSAYILEQRIEVEKNVAAYLEKVEGMKVVGSTYNIDDYRSNKDGVLRGTAYAEIEMLTDKLTLGISCGNDREEGRFLKPLITKHRALYKVLAGRDATTALACEPILAAAIRAMAAEHGKGLLKEIESAIAGKYSRPANPRRRGIADISISRGVLIARLTLLEGKNGVRFMKERVNVKGIKQLPEVMMQSMPGRALRDIVDHPYMEGLVVKTVTINKAGLQIRPVAAPVPLKDVLDDLRQAVAK